MMGRAPSPTHTDDALPVKRARPDHFSTYVPRSVVRRLKVIATIRDVPLWALVTQALEEFLESFQRTNGPLPELDERSGRERESP